jgi:hypothetical protein
MIIRIFRIEIDPATRAAFEADWLVAQHLRDDQPMA